MMHSLDTLYLFDCFFLSTYDNICNSSCNIHPYFLYAPPYDDKDSPREQTSNLALKAVLGNHSLYCRAKGEICTIIAEEIYGNIWHKFSRAFILDVSTTWPRRCGRTGVGRESRKRKTSKPRN